MDGAGRVAGCEGKDLEEVAVVLVRRLHLRLAHGPVNLQFSTHPQRYQKQNEATTADRGLASPDMEGEMWGVDLG